MKYRDFKVEDFLSDTNFQQWLLKGEEESNAFWRDWIEQNPDRKPIIEEAISLAQQIDFSKKWTDREKSDIWANVQRAISKTPNRPVLFIGFNSRLIGYMAASVLFIIGIVGIFKKQNQMIQIATTYGEIKKISLFDGSVITLNANSRLRYSKNFHNKKEREIWIDGEAFFEVSHRQVKGEKIPFIVHANKLRIQVLGTKFNVSNRRGAVNVALEQGAVKVEDIENNNNTVQLKPGEMVTQTNLITPLRKQQADLEQSMSWKNKMILFKKKSLKELSEMMMDLYNINVIIDNPELAKETFTGSFPTDSTQVLFEKLKKMYPLQITRSGNDYHIK